MSSPSEHSRATVVLRAGVASLLLAFATSATGSLLTLDPSFGTNGSQRAGLVPADSNLAHVRSLPTGGWIAFGTVAGSKVVARYLPSGVLDPSFGTGGVLRLVGLPPQVSPRSFELDATGRYLVGGVGSSCAADPCIYRLLSDGTLDASFANGGTAPLPPGNPGARADVLLPLLGGDILVAGGTAGGTGVLHVLAAGSIDAAYGTNGITVLPAHISFPFGPPASTPSSLRLASGGGIYVATANYPTSFPYLQALDLSRLDAIGHLDPAFGTGGTVSVPGTAVSFGEVEELAGGKFVGVGTTNAGAGANGNHFLFRFDGTGALDATFGVGGKADAAVIGPPTFVVATPRFARQGSKYLVAGALPGDLALARLNSDGSPDASFGSGGIASAGFAGAVQLLGTIVAAGAGGEALAIGNSFSPYVAGTLHVDAGGTTSSQLNAVARPSIDAVASAAVLAKALVGTGGNVVLIGNDADAQTDGGIAMLGSGGAPVSAFGVAGHVIASDFGLAGAVWRDGALQGDGKLVAGGIRGPNNFVLRLDGAGVPDATFGGTGILQFQSAGGTTRTEAVGVAPDGKVVVAAPALTGAFVAVHRFDAFGAPDPGFGIGGEADVTGASSIQHASALMFPGGGKVLVAGVMWTSGAYRWYVLRLLSNGLPDPSYGSSGFAYVDADPQASLPVTAAMRADGSVLVGGIANGNAVVARLTSAGVLDPSFGTGGIQPLFASHATAPSIVVTASGDALVAAADADTRWLLVRLTPSGAPDPLFGIEWLVPFRYTQPILASGGSRVVVAGAPSDPDVDKRVLVGAYTIAGAPAPLPQRSFAASYGSDADACSAVAPCRTLARALVHTARGGEVLLLDSGDFGSATILSSVSIIAPQNARPALSAATGSSALVIDATPADTIVLRGVTVSGGDNGIVFNSGGTLHLEGVTVRGYATSSQSGVIFRPATGARLSIKDSAVQVNSYGIAISNGGGNAGVLLDNVRLEGNRYAMQVKAGGTVALRNTVVSGSALVGLDLESGPGVTLTAALDRVTIVDSEYAVAVGDVGPVHVFVRNSMLAGNYRGVQISCCATLAVWLDGNRITHNSVGLEAFSGGAIYSRGNNTIEGNGTDGAPTGTYSAK